MNAVKGLGEEYSGRFALNILPDRLIDIVTTMVQEIVPLHYVIKLKVVSDTDDYEWHDKIIITFSDSAERGNLAKLSQLLRPKE